VIFGTKWHSFHHDPGRAAFQSGGFATCRLVISAAHSARRRTWRGLGSMSAKDPKRTFVGVVSGEAVYSRPCIVKLRR